MNDSELVKLLKAARPPERSSEQWTALTRSISTRLHWQPRATGDSPDRRRSWMLAWRLRLVAACVLGLLTVTFWPTGQKPAPVVNAPPSAAEYRFAELREMFPNQIRAIILTDTDARIDLAEEANHPDSQPIYLKVCGPDGCKQVITFSGRRVRLNGEEWEILANGPDGVIVTSDAAVWTTAEPARRLNDFRIEAKQIRAS